MTPDLLLGLLKLHTEEVHFQVQLTWDRAKSSLAFHAAWLTVLVGVLGRAERTTVLVGMMFCFAAVSSVLSAGMLVVGHEYYRRARDQRMRVEKLLETDLGFVTTGGMRGEPKSYFEQRWPKIWLGIVALHLLMAVLGVAGAVATFAGG